MQPLPKVPVLIEKNPAINSELRHFLIYLIWGKKKVAGDKFLIIPGTMVEKYGLYGLFYCSPKDLIYSKENPKKIDKQFWSLMKLLFWGIANFKANNLFLEKLPYRVTLFTGASLYCLIYLYNLHQYHQWKNNPLNFFLFENKIYELIELIDESKLKYEFTLGDAFVFHVLIEQFLEKLGQEMITKEEISPQRPDWKSIYGYENGDIKVILLLDRLIQRSPLTKLFYIHLIQDEVFNFNLEWTEYKMIFEKDGEVVWKKMAKSLTYLINSVNDAGGLSGPRDFCYQRLGELFFSFLSSKDRVLSETRLLSWIFIIECYSLILETWREIPMHNGFVESLIFKFQAEPSNIDLQKYKRLFVEDADRLSDAFEKAKEQLNSSKITEAYKNYNLLKIFIESYQKFKRNRYLERLRNIRKFIFKYPHLKS